MPSKKKNSEKESKKAAQKKKDRLIEDKTFGLKNKNKSKKVQQHIKSIEKSVTHSGDPKLRKQEEARKKAKLEAKARKKAQEEERNALFGEALLAVQKKSSTNKQKGKVEAKGRDGDDDGKKSGTSRAMKMMYQMDAKEMEDRLKEDPNYIPTLEDEVEAQRQSMIAKLKASGKKGTPVTEETFRAWQERKRAKHRAEVKKRVEAELRKKKGGKGLAVLTGRDLYEYKKDLFKDDEDALAVVEEEEQTDKVDQQQQVEQVAAQVETNLFLDGDDEDLSDLDDD